MKCIVMHITIRGRKIYILHLVRMILQSTCWKGAIISLTSGNALNEMLKAIHLDGNNHLHCLSFKVPETLIIIMLKSV